MRLRSFFVLGVGVAVLALAPTALGKTYHPNKRSDHADGTCNQRDCTLREAVNAANARPGTDKIVLETGKAYNLTLPNVADDEDLNATGDLDILDSVQIKSASKRLAKVNANGVDRAFESSTLAPVSTSFKYLQIRGGRTDGAQQDGGGLLLRDGSHRIQLSRITGNVAERHGGGIANRATASITTIDRSRISGNRATFGGGGGVLFDSNGLVSRSTVDGNTGTDGGGISSAGPLTLVNSTFTNNAATSLGGGLYAGGTGSMNAVTVVRNTSSQGGGIAKNGSPYFVGNSLIALNSSPFGPDCANGNNEFISLGQNLVGNNSGCLTLGPAFGDLVNLSSAQIGVSTLKDNGGPTKTVALKKGSLAINRAGSDAPKRDQRGEKRKKPDIGAFERE